MCIVDYDIGDLPDSCNFTTPKARKPYRCCECGRGTNILPGERYEKMTGKWDGKFLTFRTCLPCVEIRSAFVCSYEIGDMWTNIADSISQCDLNLGCLDGLRKEAMEKFFLEYERRVEIWDEE